MKITDDAIVKVRNELLRLGIDATYADATLVAEAAAPEIIRANLKEAAEELGWPELVTLTQEILKRTYPESVFDGSSGDMGVTFIVALRDFLTVHSDSKSVNREFIEGLTE